MEYPGKFFGTMILVMFGMGANCQVNLSANINVSPTPAGVNIVLIFTSATYYNDFAFSRILRLCLGWGTVSGPGIFSM